jgi:uncharacterized membrane protein
MFNTLSMALSIVLFLSARVFALLTSIEGISNEFDPAFDELDYFGNYKFGYPIL